MSTNQSRNAYHTHWRKHCIRSSFRSRTRSQLSSRPVKESVLTFPLRALLASSLESGPNEAVVGPHAVSGIHNQSHGRLTPTLQSDTGSYLTALPCSVCLRHSPAPFPRSTTHTKTHAWSPPPPLLSLLGERERERESEETPVELYKVRQSKPRPLEISRWICFLTSLLYHVSGSFTWGKSSLLSTVQVMTSHTLSQSKARVHMAKNDTFTTLTCFQQNYFLYQNCLFSHFLFCCSTPCNATRVI